MPPKSVKIKSNERVFLAGKTGSGKTYLARHLLKAYKRLVVIDSKGTLTDWGLDPWDRETKRRLKRGEDVRARVTFDIVQGLEDEWNSLFAFLFEEVKFNFTLYIDETYGVVDFGTRAPPGLVALYTRGREFGIGVWAATQRPLGVPLVQKSEAEHVFMFRLILRGDRMHMGEFMGEEVTEGVIPDEHGFYYKKVDWFDPVYVPIFNPKEGSFDSASKKVSEGKMQKLREGG